MLIEIEADTRRAVDAFDKRGWQLRKRVYENFDEKQDTLHSIEENSV